MKSLSVMYNCINCLIQKYTIKTILIFDIETFPIDCSMLFFSNYNNDKMVLVSKYIFLFLL